MGQHGRAQVGVLLHDVVFIIVQFARLVQDGVGDGNFTDIVHGRGLAQQFGLLLRHPTVDGQQVRVTRDASDVVAGFLAAGFTDGTHREDHFPLRFGDFRVEILDFLDAVGHAVFQVRVQVLQGFLGIKPRRNHLVGDFAQ